MAITTKHNELPFIKFMNTKITIVNIFDVHELIINAISNGCKEYICLTDVGNVISATHDEQLQTAINTAFLSLADGTHLAYYTRLAGHNRIERISGLQLMQFMFAKKDRLSVGSREI